MIAFVTFSGNDIKDLYVHEKTAASSENVESLPSVPPANANDKKDQSVYQPPKPPVEGDQNDKRKNRSNTQNANSKRETNKVEGTAGTGAHLLSLREKKGADSSQSIQVSGEFDFQAGLNIFKKEEVLAKVAKEKEGAEIALNEVKYKKDDFFDSLSCSLTDRQEGVNNRLTHSQERILNQDTFGAVALQSNNNYRRGGGGGYRGGGGDNSGGGRGRGGGRGYGGRNHYNNNYNNSNNNNGGGRGSGRGRGRGRYQNNNNNNNQQPSAPISG